jgi:hypothetical protein
LCAGVVRADLVGGEEERVLIFHVFEGVEDLDEARISIGFLLILWALFKRALLVAHYGGARPPSVIAVDADPGLLELRLDHLEPVQRAHLRARRPRLLTLSVRLRQPNSAWLQD